MDNLSIHSLFNTEETIAKDIFSNVRFPWEILPKLSDFIVALGNTLDEEIYEKKGENIWIAKSAKVAESASLTGPLIVDENAQIRQCAFIRGSVIVGKHTVVGNSCEVKNSLLFNNVAVPHFNYVGDSILGYHSHFGAGVITSNIKSDQKNIIIKDKDKEYVTGMRKIGAILGDYVEMGCNCVLNPGSIIGKNCMVYPLTMIRGVIEKDSIVKNKSEIEIVQKRS